MEDKEPVLTDLKRASPTPESNQLEFQLLIGKTVEVVGFGLLILLILLGCLELSFRLAGMAPAQPAAASAFIAAVADNWVGYRQTPNLRVRDEDFWTNAWGLRSKREYSEIPEKNRVVVLGTSVVAGMGYPMYASIAQSLEQQLLRENIDAEVLNYGIPSSTIENDIGLVVHYIRRIHPSVLVLNVDVSTAHLNHTWPMPQLKPLDQFFQDGAHPSEFTNWNLGGLVKRGAYHSALLNWFDQKRAERASTPVSNNGKDRLEVSAQQIQDQWKHFRSFLAAIATFCNQQEIHFVVATPFGAYDHFSDEDFPQVLTWMRSEAELFGGFMPTGRVFSKEASQIIRDLSRSYRFHVLDMSPLNERLESVADTLLSADELHLTAQGGLKLGEELAKVVAPLLKAKH